jgi:hypothetical protein
MATEKFIVKSVFSELVEYTGSNVSEIASLTMESCWEAYQINPLNVENQYHTSLPENAVEGTAEGEWTKYLFFPYQTYYVPTGGYAGKCGGALCLHANRAEVLATMEVYPQV